MSQTIATDETFGALLAQLAVLQAQVSADIQIVEDKLPELRRIGKAAAHRRGGAGSRDARKYELGSVLVMVGLEGIDSKAMLGLFAHPVLMVRWLGQAAVETGRASLGELTAIALADPKRLAFCRQWGRVLGWRYRKPLYDAGVTSFVNSGRTGPNEPWRKLDITDDQATLIATLCSLLDQPLPDFLTRGQAFDWIYVRGGNPHYWNEPEIPQEWKE